MSREEKIQEALKGLKEGLFPSVRRAAKFFEIPETTLRNRYHGARKTRVEAHEEQQWLSTEEEESVVRHSLLVDDLGFPLTYGLCREIAEDLYQQSHKGEEVKFGEHWVGHFLKRHKELKGKVGKGISCQRSTGSNPAIMCKFLEEVHRVVVEENILPSNIWNMDEK